MNKIFKRLTPEHVFMGIAMINVCIMVMLLIFSEGARMAQMTYGEGNFGDFWECIRKIIYNDSIYGNVSDPDAIYPPLMFSFLNIFATIVKDRQKASELFVSTTGYGMLCLVMYIILFVVLFIEVLHYFYKSNSGMKKAILAFTLIFSYPFWGCAFERGNPVMYAMLFLMIGLSLRDSDNCILREISLIMVAVSAGFKLYPAVFGLLWIVEKRYKEAGRLVLYGLAAFFIPFHFWGGIFNGVANYLITFSGYLGKGLYSETSILGDCIILFGERGKIIGQVCIVCWIIWVIYYLFSEKITWKSIALLTSTQTILLAESYVYTFVFISIPLCFFLNMLNKKKVYTWSDYLYAMLFALIFTCPPVADRVSGVTKGLYLAWIAMLLLISLEKVYHIVNS